ncbi:hypothetical protein CHS0354_038409 [Potamilus streckersoni]|uniref:Caveolin n=1 Tax=Potamilus streckersoni TaxID=2493646 RepID=A0AAE0S5R2_9BIVA|nr:hypothetical protein CHS0354_038409 [Potamilus streckersoni]
MADLDLVKRDPNEMNSHIKVTFEDVFGEPEGVRSIDCVWSTSYACFNCGKNCMYIFLTTLCGLCIGLEWGCTFACTSFQHIWCLTPCLREFSIACGFLQKCFGIILNCSLAPICEACGMFFTKIQVHKK